MRIERDGSSKNVYLGMKIRDLKWYDYPALAIAMSLMVGIIGYVVYHIVRVVWEIPVLGIVPIVLVAVFRTGFIILNNLDFVDSDDISEE